MNVPPCHAPLPSPVPNPVSSSVVPASNLSARLVIVHTHLLLRCNDRPGCNLAFKVAWLHILPPYVHPSHPRSPSTQPRQDRWLGLVPLALLPSPRPTLRRLAASALRAVAKVRPAIVTSILVGLGFYNDPRHRHRVCPLGNRVVHHYRRRHQRRSQMMAPGRLHPWHRSRHLTCFRKSIRQPSIPRFPPSAPPVVANPWALLQTASSQAASPVRRRRRRARHWRRSHRMPVRFLHVMSRRRPGCIPSRNYVSRARHWFPFPLADVLASASILASFLKLL